LNQDPNPESFLLGCFDFERERSNRRKNKPFTLDRVQRALAEVGHPESGLEVIHIAGTKGKGSCLELIYRGLKQNGINNIGLFTSPHFISLCERVRIDDSNIPLDKFEVYAKQIMKLNTEKFEGDLSFFECLFLIAIIYFRDSGVSKVILETGLGGRLDATNSIPSQLSVLTRIDYDHTEILGETLDLIATEKAGIIKQNSEVIALEQLPEVNESFSIKAKEKSASINWVKLKEKPEGRPVSLWENSHIADKVVSHILPHSKLGLEFYLAQNLMGRMENRIFHGQEFLLDGAHNRVSLRNLNKDIHYKGKKLNLLYAMSESRSPEDLINELSSKKIVSVTFVELPGGRPGHDPQELKQVWDQRFSHVVSKVIPLDRLGDWCTEQGPEVKLVTGSIYLVGEVMKFMDENKTL